MQYLPNKKIYRKNTYQIVQMFTLGVTVLGMSCTKKQAEEVMPENPSSQLVTIENVTYENFVNSLFQTKCSSCHAQGNSASSIWTLSGYSSIKNNASAINNAVLIKKTMPMGGMLTTKELELLTAWFEKNLPEN